MKKQHKLMTIISTLCLSLIAVGVGAFAYFTAAKEDDKSVTAGTVSIELKEIFPSDGGEFGENTTSKTFWGVATGSKKSIARASIFVSIEYKNGNNWEVLGSIPSNAVTYDISANTLTNWKLGTDGYYYYQKVLEGNENGTASDTYAANNYTTTQFELTNVKISEAYAETAAAYDNVRINMLVTMETCQATNKAYTLSWPNCDTSVLPEGVK